MRNWQFFPLHQVAEIGSGAGFPLEYQGRQEDEFPFLKVSDMNILGNERVITHWNNTVSAEVRRRLRAVAFAPGSVIFPKIGAAIATNKKRILSCAACVDNNVMAITPHPNKLDGSFLFYLLQQKNLSDFASKSNPPSIRKSDVERWEVPVPPFPEQRRIVDILSRAEGIVRLQRQAADKAREIIPALFLDMFGDPATNPKGWPVTTIGEVARSTDYGTSKKASAGGEGIAVIRMGNVTMQGSLELDDLKYVELDVDEIEKCRLETGDILFNRTNSKELVGKTGLWDGRFDAVAASYFIRVRLDKNRADPVYVWAFMNTAHMKERLYKTARGAIGQSNINAQELKAFPLPLPPIKLQRAYATHLQEILSLISARSVSSERSDQLFQSLLHRAFSGAL